MLPIHPGASLLGRVGSVPIGYLLLWLGSLALSATLIVVLRTRWGESRPLQKCALLSLLVHLLLAWASITVRFVVGDGMGGRGMGPPIRVRIVREAAPSLALADVPDASDSVADFAPPLLEPPKEDAEAAAVEDKRAEGTEEANPPAVEENVESDQAPALADVDATKNALPVPEKAISTPVDAGANGVNDLAAKPEAATNTAAGETAINATPAAAASQPSSANVTTVVAATPYSLRTAPGRLGLVESEGGSGETEAAVAAALRWLAAAQSRDGRWDANQFGAGQEYSVLGHNRGGAGRGADTGVSALALLAFLGAGHSHIEGEHRDTVRRGLDFLLRSQVSDGSIFGNATLYAQMYCHSMATFALAEAQAMTGDKRLEPAVLKAVGYCVAAQNATSGGWRYRPGDIGDTSQLGWQMMALASARRAGIGIPSQTWVGIERFLRSVRRGTHGGLASYRPDSGPSTSMTAEALYCRLLLTEVLAGEIDEASATEATSQLIASLPNAERINLYYWYYATLALHYRHGDDERGAESWRVWNEALTSALLATQVSDGHDAGSWSTNTLWGGYGGRVYTTAMAAMCLEVYYRYAPQPAERGRWTATRPETVQPSR